MMAKPKTKLPSADPGKAVAILVGELLPPDDERAQRILRNVNDFIEMAHGALADSTLAALRSDGQLFASWCRRHHKAWLPADPETVAKFVLDLGAVRKPTTISRYIASIALWHRAADLPNPTDALRVDMARRKIARAWAQREDVTLLKQAPPLGQAEMDEVLAAIAAKPVLLPSDVRDRALLLVARDSMARASELVALRWEDLEADESDGSGTIVIRRGKTDQTGEGRVAWLAPETMAALAAWRQVLIDHIAAVRERFIADLKQREKANQRFYRSQPRIASLMEAERRARARLQNLPEAPGQRIFWQLDGQPSDRLTRESVSRIFKARSAAATGRMEFSAHSTRVGTAQDLIEAGADLVGIMNAGGWKSPAMVARYTKRLAAGGGAVAQMRKGRSAER